MTGALEIAFREMIVAAVREATQPLREQVVALRSELASRTPAPSAAHDDPALSVDELCRRGGFSRALAYRKMKDGSLASVQVGRRRLIPGNVARDVLSRGLPPTPS